MTTINSKGNACLNLNENAPISVINLMGLGDRVKDTSQSIKELVKVLRDDLIQEHRPNYQPLDKSYKKALLIAIEVMAGYINEDVEVVIEEPLAIEGYYNE